MGKIRRALLSVYDKTGLVPFAQVLARCGVELLSTGGTAKLLREAGLTVRDLSEYTGFPEMLDGRVKTLHPKVHGGLLFVRENEEHQKQVAQQGIEPIDLVAVNLYPFERIVQNPSATLDEVIENIDIGGPAIIRSAAKNYRFVTIVTDPLDYAEVARQIEETGETTLELRQRLALKAFARTAAYDATITAHLPRFLGTKPEEVEEFPHPWTLHVQAPLVQRLRYGENPHQAGALYGHFSYYYEQLHGKELSYNNVLDLTAATGLIYEFMEDRPTVAILKHTTPCGVGQADSLRDAWEKAFATDRQAPFGGIIAVNRPLDRCTAEAIAEIFSEVIVAPEFQPDALEVLQKKKNLRLMRVKRDPRSHPSWEIRSVGAESYLWQERDLETVRTEDLQVVTERQPTEQEMRAMLFGWKIVKHVKSNAVLFAAEDRTLGIGAGQMSRVDAVKLAIWKASQSGLSLHGSVVCSDAFFPFPDGVEAAAEAGATAVIQPGGSIRDQQVIDAANRHGMAMVFTRMRHFRH